MTSMKKLFTLIIVLLVLIFGTIGIAAYFAKDIINSVKPQIEEQASKTLGAKVTLGDIDIGFFPNCYLQTKNLSIGTNPQGPKLGLFKASIAVMPIFSGKIAINEILITAPSATIKQTNQGVEIVGLVFPTPNSNSASTPPATSSTQGSKKDSSGPAELPVTIDLEKFELKNASLTYINEVNGQTFNLRDVTLTTHLSIAKNIISIPDLDGALSVNGSIISYGLKGKFSPSAIDLTELTFSAFGGKGLVKSSGEIGKQLATTIQLNGFESGQALALVKPDLASTISGTLTDLNTKLSTSFTSNGVITVGEGAVEIKDGGIKGVNLVGPLVKSILKATPPMPGSSDSMEISAEEQRAIDSPDTTFSTIKTSFALNKTGISFDGLSILSALFELQGNGNLTNSGNIDMKASVVLSERLSTALVKKNKDLANVARPDKRIEAPMSISGPVQKPLVVPDISKLIQNALAGKLGQKADEAIQKVLGGKGLSLKGLGF